MATGRTRAIVARKDSVYLKENTPRHSDRSRPTYGKAGRYQDKGDYFNDVFVYDTQTDYFGRADALPINNNAPMAVVRGETIYLLGGETGGGWIEGEYYGHHPDLLLMGRIEPIK